ncbi:claudin-7-like [Archocentrus centrarchus]|uniref:claudin-7-like n=1 Tax=Archocentrus centrarchus TaxID=63155 RepID=UPI0011EA4CC1|nr:claudin-7-like [Archocentrus centrarchus]
MATSGLQILGFFLSLVGIAATIAAMVMVEWKKTAQGKYRSYEGFWMSCTAAQHRATCESYQSILKVQTEIQVTRAVLLVSLILSALAILVSTVGMKCTHFMDDAAESKSNTAMMGGIMFILSGLLTIIITSWFVKTIIQSSYNSIHMIRPEFGNAPFVSWIGGLLTAVGGCFLSCRRCWRSKATGSINVRHLIPTNKPKADYV